MPNTLTAEKPIAPAAAARDVRYDLLRIMAAFMVVLLHTASSMWYSTAYNSFDWAVMNVYDSLVRSAVPLFFMLSGAFLLKNEIDLKKLWLKKILPLTGIFIVWSVLYSIDTFGITTFFRTNPLSLLVDIVKSHYHMWFIPTLIGVYILQPILYAISHFKEGKYLRYFLHCFFVWTVLRTTAALLLESKELLVLMIVKIPVEGLKYSGYMLLGYYLANKKQYRIRPWIAAVMFLAVAACSAGICQIAAFLTGEPSDVLYGYYTLPVFAEAILLFLCFQNMNTDRLSSPKASAIVGTLSSLTFGIYLLHPFILDKLETHLHLHPMSFAPIVSIPVIAVITILTSGAITFVMLKIPVVKRLWKL